MVSETSEKALEDLIEAAFLSAGYVQGSNKDFDADLALDTKQFWAFLEATQSEELDKLRPYADWQARVLNRLNNKIKKDGILTVLKKGLSVESAHLKLLYRLPYNTLNPEVERLFGANIFSVTRQVHFSNATPMDSVDMVLFINGLPIVTMELKQPWKGQNVHHARKQYQDRNHREPLFEFGRCLVHFAVDTHDVSMATKLAGKSTFFLPFNKGDGHGKGNPINPTGHKTAYLWEEVLEKRSLTNIIEHFAKMVEEENKETGKKTKTLFFPRYHQLDVVRQVLNDVKSNGVGQRYLIQHSAGSGKSNSITWLGYQLIETYNADGTANIFDSVIVVTDRRVLDKQLKDNIRAFSEVKNVVAHAYDSAELKKALENGKKLIITTIQKFPWILDGIADLSDRKFAVIIDEAHSSQSGSAADKMNEAISGGGDEEEPEDLQDKILVAMARRKMGNNASFFAFTATPKNTTLERFGRQNAEGKFVPFHLYSMKQAIEEQFILDVLKNYTTYKSYYELQKSIEDNPEFNTKKAQGKLRAYVEAHPDTIKTKAAIMLDHFRDNVVRPKKLKGKARAMVVTRNIESAIRYFLAIREALNAAGSPYKAVVAFTGKKLVDGVEHTEDSLNGFPGNDIAKKFKDDEYRILVVANKFLTGFDEPMLTTMYVDKKLQGVLAVQALSRLNRSNKKLGKEETFILDFHNTVEDIKDAFDPFYTSTALSQPTDVNVLHDLKDHLDDTGIYEWDEVVQFNELFFEGVEADQLSPILDTAAGRFDELEDDEKIDIKIKAKQFVKIYAQVACIIPFENADWEMLHWFLKFLIPEMKVKDKDQDEIDGLMESVDLTTYGLERVKIGHTIGLDDSGSEIVPPNPNPRGGHDDPEKDPLDMIVAAFNERYFNGWDATPEEQRIKLINILNHAMSDPAFQNKVVSNPDEQNRRIASEALFEKAMRNERRREIDLYKKYASDDDFKSGLHEALMRMMEQVLKSGDHRPVG
ncbi:type I restriction endonuclease subunit R [Ruegeria faecimaris]|uniref:type I restriction endonuclease subunit R n=2 Tax=Roseobacteraceae TaxID=2854170 RepID=UPI00232AC31A|nr:type I restriction endonuclease [Ruegeria faecimaris]